MDTANNEDNSLKNAAKVFNKIGWEKKLCDLTEEQMVALISVIQSSRR